MRVLKLKEITILGRGITISSDLITTACKEQVQINLLSSSGQVVANIISPFQSESIRTARSQIKAAETDKGKQLAQSIVLAKINNQLFLLEQIASGSNELDVKTHRKISRHLESIKKRADYLNSQGSVGLTNNRLLAIEGTASNCYWLALRPILGPKRFIGRRGRGATDPINSLLNYGYAILQNQVLSATLRAGLLPFAGFIHQDRPGKPSFILDAMELFRQPVVDSAIIALLESYTPKLEKSGQLDQTTIKKLYEAINTNLDSKLVFIDGKRHRLQEIIYLQVQLIASFLKDDRQLTIWSQYH